MKGRSILAALAACMALLAAPAQAYLFSAVISFGDSLSDTGTSGLMTPRPPLAPSPPYADGRFTNGPVATEVLAQGLGVPLKSYAVGGALSGVGNADVADTNSSPYFSGVVSQVAKYLTDSGGAADPNALYVVLGGSNDFLALLPALDGAPQETVDALLTSTAATVITNLTAAVYTLYLADATQFLLPLLPDIGMAPAVSDLDVSAAIFGVNQTLNAAYLDLFAQLADPGVRFTIFDTFAAQTGLAIEFPDTVTPCLDATTGDVCSDPNSSFFWDDLHPTAHVHALLGAQLLAAVPEPGSMVLAGLALAGLATSRRRQPAPWA